MSHALGPQICGEVENATKFYEKLCNPHDYAGNLFELLQSLTESLAIALDKCDGDPRHINDNLIVHIDTIRITLACVAIKSRHTLDVFWKYMNALEDIHNADLEAQDVKDALKLLNEQTIPQIPIEPLLPLPEEERAKYLERHSKDTEVIAVSSFDELIATVDSLGLTDLSETLQKLRPKYSKSTPPESSPTDLPDGLQDWLNKNDPKPKDDDIPL